MNQCVAESRLLANQFEIDVFPLRFADSIDDIGRIRVRKIARSFLTAWRLILRVAKRPPDLAYFTVSPVGGAFYRDCLFLAVLKMFRVPRVLHLHGKGVNPASRRIWRRALYRWAFRKAWVIQLSPALAQDVAGVTSHDRLLFVPNGVLDRAAYPDRNHLPSRIPRILFLSNMKQEKGPLVLLEALGELHRRGVSFHATFAGAPTAGCIEAFDSGVERLGLGGQVRYVGPVYGDAKESLLAEHDVFAFPTFYPQEAFPIVLLEAMQHSLPVVTTFEGAIPDVVEDGVTGYLVPQRDVLSLASRLAELLSSPTQRVAMGRKGRARYLDRFTLEHFEQRLADALQQATGHARTHRTRARS